MEKTKLQKRRELAGLSVKELADRIGLSEKTLQAYDSGQKDIRKMRLANFLALLDALDCCQFEDIISSKYSVAED